MNNGKLRLLLHVKWLVYEMFPPFLGAYQDGIPALLMTPSTVFWWRLHRHCASWCLDDYSKARLLCQVCCCLQWVHKTDKISSFASSISSLTRLLDIAVCLYCGCYNARFNIETKTEMQFQKWTVLKCLFIYVLPKLARIGGTVESFMQLTHSL